MPLKADGRFAGILVPLDGSRMAEAALPAASAIALAFEARVTLLHVLEQRPPATIHGERHLMDAAEAAAYLDQTAARLREAGVETVTHVHDSREGDVARSIVEHAGEYAPDLVVLCAHGRSGLRDLLFGNIAQQVLRRDRRAVLVVPPAVGADAPSFQLRCILVPLDQSPGHEEGLTAGQALGRAFGAELHLLVVVPTMSTLAGERAATGLLLPRTTRALLDLAQQEGREYLEHMAAGCREQGLEVSTEVLRGDPVPTVLDHATAVDADLLVMASHGRLGLDAFLTGSVAPRISARVTVPLLLVRVENGAGAE